MSEIKDRLREARRNKGLSQAGLSKLLGVSQAAIAAIESGRNKRPTNLASIAKALDVSPYWLETGKEDNEVVSNATPLGKIEEWDNDTPLLPEDCEVPLYKEVRLSAGNGFSDDIEDYNGYKLRFSKSTLRRHGINPADVVCVTADGDSMEPVFPSGATLGINTADKTIRDGQIYAINHGGLLRTKILHKLPENKVRIRSYNQAEYPDEEASLDDLSVIGRVFWWSVIV